MLKCKIHRATVTQAELDYVGSITIDAKLLAASGLLPYEKVHIVNINNGERFETYVIEGPADTGVIASMVQLLEKSKSRIKSSSWPMRKSLQKRLEFSNHKLSLSQTTTK
jgi:hypothetical protein